ncbi:LCP family protein [Streptomyces sp. NPDC050617]|uniref:LCP family protein n=1 Tax=Streptomyces sp. NPDC050617 TaxID=3154628 RepID=UPI0034326B91
MNDRQDPYAQEPHVYGYDAYGQPVYQPNDPQRVYDQYGQPLQQQGQHGQQGQQHGQSSQHGQYGQHGQHGQYGQSIPQQQPYQDQQQYDPYGAGAQQGYGYDPYAQQSYEPQQLYPQHQQSAQQPHDQQHQPQYQQSAQGQSQQLHQPQQAQQQVQQQEWIPQQAAAPHDEKRAGAPAEGVSERAGTSDRADTADAADKAAGGEEYRTEQFSFIEEPDEDSEDVIDWLKFSESRTERRDERKRQGRNRVVVLIVVLALVVAGGVGYLWYAGMLPGTGGDSKGAAASGGAQKRDVIVVHLRETKGGGSSTALLVDNETTHRGTTVLLPNTLAVTTDGGGATTLGKSVQDGGTGGTRDALNTLLGADIKGSWRLDTPYLENLVELVGGITLDADATIPGAKKDDSPRVKQGKDQGLNGQAAVAYATYRAPGEAQAKQLARFGQVMQAVLKKVSTDTGSAVNTVESLAQIPDPSLSEKQLGASLSHLAALVKKGSYDTELLPVQGDGTLSQKATDSVVKDVLGGTVKKTASDAPPRVSVKNATGKKTAAGAAQISLVNGGYTVVDGGTQSGGQGASKVTYSDEKRAAQAKEIAKTLGLPAGAVAKGDGAPNADVTVVLGSDYKG